MEKRFILRGFGVGALGGLLAFIPVTLSSVRHIVTMPEPVDDDAASTELAASA